MAKAAEGKPVANGVEENSELLNCKTWVLRVSIHCEGCKKKVDKILRKIEGVYRTDIDLKQQRVTVTGNVEAETLISRLEKKTHRRPILLLPDKATSKAATKEQKHSKPKPRETTNKNSNNNRNVEGEAPKEDNKAENKTECRQPDAAAKPSGESGPSKNGAGEGKGAEDRKEAKEEKQPEEAKQERKPAEAKQSGSVTVPAGEQSAVPEKPAAEKVGDSEESGSGSGSGSGTARGNGGKKKKPRGQNGNNGQSKEGKMGEEVSSGGEPVSDDPSPDPSPSQDQGSSGDRGPVTGPMNYIPPHQQPDTYPYMSPYAPHYYHGPPTHAVRYNTAHPMGSYGASHYAPQPPPSSYAYMNLGQESESALPYSDPHAVQRSDSFELFSDENPNACSIM